MIDLFLISHFFKGWLLVLSSCFFSFCLWFTLKKISFLCSFQNILIFWLLMMIFCLSQHSCFPPLLYWQNLILFRKDSISCFFLFYQLFCFIFYLAHFFLSFLSRGLILHPCYCFCFDFYMAFSFIFIFSLSLIILFLLHFLLYYCYVRSDFYLIFCFPIFFILGLMWGFKQSKADSIVLL